MDRKIILLIEKESYDVQGRDVWLGNVRTEDIDLEYDTLETELLKLKGSFALIHESVECIKLACDYIRSIPLFYCVTENAVLVSDNAEKIQETVNMPIDEKNVAEYLRTGYTTESETIFQSIYQVEPGQCVTIRKGSGEIEKIYYFKLQYQLQPENTNEGEWIDKLDKCFIQVFEELAKRLDGRTVLVPLSGGCDSRTVAVMLRRLGYNNVICFSYGRKGNKESVVSEKVADALGYKWLFVEYNDRVWKNFLESSDYRDFLRFSSGGGGLAVFRHSRLF